MNQFADMQPVTVLAMTAVTCMLVSYTLKPRNRWFFVVFAVSWSLGATYLFLEGAWLIGSVQAVLAAIAVRRIWKTFR
jgi:hypothetical protein